MTARIVWKKLTAAVFWLISGGLAALAWLFHYVTPKPGRHAADDGQDWADVLRRIPSPLRKRVVPPVAGARVTAAVLGQMTGRPPLNVTRAQLGLPEHEPSHADLDQYLTGDALRYPAGFDVDHPELAGELIPPWPGPWIDGADVGAGFVVQPTLPPLPEPDVEYLPHACPDVDQPTAILRAARASLCHGKDRCALDARCPFFVGCCSAIEIPEAVVTMAGELRAEAVGDLCADFIAAHIDAPPEDVPGLAEHASPNPPADGAEAATPEAVASAGPGTTTMGGQLAGKNEDRCDSGTAVGGQEPAPLVAAHGPDVTDLDDPRWLDRLTGWALYAPLDQVKAAAR